MNQELCDIKENQGNEICKLLRSLAKNREKLSNDIKGIYKDLDTMTKDNQNVINRLTNTIRKTGGGKKETKKESKKKLKNFIGKLKNHFNKDNEWETDLLSDLFHQENINSIKEFNNLINNDNDFRNWLENNYDTDVSELIEILKSPTYGNLVMERENLLNTIYLFVKKFKIKVTDDVNEFTNQRLYKRLSKYITTYKKDISEKEFDKLLEVFEQKTSGEYHAIQLYNIIESKLHKNLQQAIRHCEISHKDHYKKKQQILDYINKKSTDRFIKKAAKILKKTFHTKLLQIQVNLENSGIGRKYFKISTGNGSIHVNKIPKNYFRDIMEIVKIDYEKYLVDLPPVGDVIHPNELPSKTFKSINIKQNADSMFGSIAYCLTDPVLFKHLTKICKTKKGPIIEYLKENLIHFQPNESDINYISKERLQIAQQVLRGIVSRVIPEYIKEYPHYLNMLKILSESDDYNIYKNLDFPLNFESYLSNIDKKIFNKLTINFQNLVLQSETNNPEEDLDNIYWGDHISLNILNHFFNKKCNIILISISGTNDKIRDGFYVYSYQREASIRSSKYAILLRHSPRTNTKLGINYYSLVNEENKSSKEKYLHIDYSDSNYEKYSEELKDFIDDIIYIE